MNGQFREHWAIAIEMQQAYAPAAGQADRVQKILGKQTFPHGIKLPRRDKPATRVPGNGDRRLMRVTVGPTVKHRCGRHGEMRGGKDAVPPDVRPWQRWKFAIRTSQLWMGSG
ncbi:hypothetical protein [Sphingobium sp. LB126]|uniref:hypothetical protein n=1 Tax=Sphingobium sp. LB126 TaxID=1983755 RepID=UPI0012FDFDE0|nr:hypothetical protein [Sphingobium sp. LB126]